MRRLLPSCLAGGLAVVVLLAGGAPAQADDAAQARREAAAAARTVDRLTHQLQTAVDAYDEALSGVGTSLVASVRAQDDHAAAQAVVDRARQEQVQAARALYMSGGQLGLFASVLDSTDAQDLAVRMVSIRRVMASGRGQQVAAARTADRLGAVARAAAAGADATVVTADAVRQRAATVQRLLGQAQATLDHLSARARRLTAAQKAAEALARARAAAAAAESSAIGAVSAEGIPASYERLYRAAALTCPGMPWTLLAAVGQVESGHGRNNGPSSAGAVGPMQFMPRTFATYAVDGDHDGRTDPWSPADAIFTAAHFLCVGGASSPAGWQHALLRYNNAQWYVDLVLSVQAQLAATTTP